jgi:hypothetical protein
MNDDGGLFKRLGDSGNGVMGKTSISVGQWFFIIIHHS